MKARSAREQKCLTETSYDTIYRLNRLFTTQKTFKNLTQRMGMLFFTELGCSFFAAALKSADSGYLKNNETETHFSFMNFKEYLESNVLEGDLENRVLYAEYMGTRIAAEKINLKNDVLIYAVPEDRFELFNLFIPLFKLFSTNRQLTLKKRPGNKRKEDELSRDLELAEKEIGEKSVLFILSEIFSSSLSIDSKITSSLEMLKTYLDLKYIILQYREGEAVRRFFSGSETDGKESFEKIINSCSYEYNSKRGRVYFLEHQETPQGTTIVILELVQKQKVFGFIALPLPLSKKSEFRKRDFYKTFAGIFSQGIMIDLTILSLKSMKNFNNNILESMTSGLVCISNTGMITRMNKSAHVLLFGHYEDKIIGKDYNDFASMKPFSDLIYKTIKEDREFSGQEIKLYTDDEKRIFGVSTSVLRDNDEKIGALMIFRDLTRIQNLKKKLFQREKLAALGEMAAKVAHEIKNPLTTIRGFIELISKELPDNEELGKFSKMVFYEVDYLVETLDDLLRFTRASEPTEEYEFFNIDINQFVSDVIFVEKLSKKVKNVSFEKRFEKNLPLASVEPRKLKRVLSNLFVNAAEAYNGVMDASDDPDQGRRDLLIRVTCSLRENSCISIRVTDNGPGMDDNIKSKVFSPFFTTKGRGTGLGLAICERIMNKMHGSLRFRSIRGIGTCFEVLLEQSGPKEE
jgi:two-component system nitrogen regulation sensor histidine kinase GlnL